MGVETMDKIKSAKGYCANCGSWSDVLKPVYWQTIGEVEMYCESCKGEDN